MSKRQVLYRKWRPQTFADFVGQDHIKQTIVNEVKSGNIAHAYLFAGPRGTGKTSMARLLARAVNCLEPDKSGEPCGKCANCKAASLGSMIDLIEIDAASHTGVDDVRDLIEKINLAPSVGKYKVYIIDEVHMLSKNAFNALLKTLEEPPEHAMFILATTEVHKLLPTVVSRCQYFDFHHLTWQEIINQLKKIAKKEKIEITDEALNLIAQNSEGSMRDALSILEQLIGLSEKKIDKDVLAKVLGITDNQVVADLTQAIIDRDTNKGVDIVNNTYFKGYDIDQLAKNWINYLRQLLMIKLGNVDSVSGSAMQVNKNEIMRKQVESISYNELINLMQKIIENTNKYKIASLPQLALELVIVKCAGVEDSKTGKSEADSGVVLPDGKTPQNDKGGESGKKVGDISHSSNGETENKTKVAVAKKVDVPVDLWMKLCHQISNTNPALAALIKNTRTQPDSEGLVIQTSSQFLHDMISKKTNLALIHESLKKLGQENICIKCELIKEEQAANQVAEVFDII